MAPASSGGPTREPFRNWCDGKGGDGRGGPESANTERRKLLVPQRPSFAFWAGEERAGGSNRDQLARRWTGNPGKNQSRPDSDHHRGGIDGQPLNATAGVCLVILLCRWQEIAPDEAVKLGQLPVQERLHSRYFS